VPKGMALDFLSGVMPFVMFQRVSVNNGFPFYNKIKSFGG
jgi:hypothetical protein